MNRYIIRYNAGYGDMYEVIEADDDEIAEKTAYEAWRDDVESQADYEAMNWTEELAEEYGLD